MPFSLLGGVVERKLCLQASGHVSAAQLDVLDVDRVDRKAKAQKEKSEVHQSMGFLSRSRKVMDPRSDPGLSQWAVSKSAGSGQKADKTLKKSVSKAKQSKHKWWFPFRHGGTPSYHPS